MAIVSSAVRYRTRCMAILSTESVVRRAQNCGECWSDYLGLAVLPVGITKMSLKELARRIAWQLFDEVDRARDLITGKMLATEHEELLCQRWPWFDADGGLNHRLYLLAEVFVGYSEHCHV